MTLSFKIVGELLGFFIQKHGKILSFDFVPFYFIEIRTKNGNHLSGVREHDSIDIDFVYRFFKEKAERKYTVIRYSCVKLSKFSHQVKEYIKKDRKPPREGGPPLKDRP